LYVSVALSTNTDVYPGSIGGETWQKSDRQDANEYYYVIRSVVPKGSEVELPYLETSFKTVGVYEVRYTIVLEGYQVIEGCCALNAYESKSGS
jgi:hypothetical protein